MTLPERVSVVLQTRAGSSETLAVVARSSAAGSPPGNSGPASGSAVVRDQSCDGLWAKPLRRLAGSVLGRHASGSTPGTPSRIDRRHAAASTRPHATPRSGFRACSMPPTRRAISPCGRIFSLADGDAGSRRARRRRRADPPANSGNARPTAIEVITMRGEPSSARRMRRFGP